MNAKINDGERRRFIQAVFDGVPVVDIAARFGITPWAASARILRWCRRDLGSCRVCGEAMSRFGTVHEACKDGPCPDCGGERYRKAKRCRRCHLAKVRACR